MPRKTTIIRERAARRALASMRPRPDAAENDLRLRVVPAASE